MSGLKYIVETIKAKKQIANMEKDLANITDPGSRRMKLGNVKRAKEDLKQLFMDYRKELQRRVAFIVVTGEHAQKFADTAENEFGCFSVNADSFYESIADQVPEVLYKGKSSSPSLFDYLMGKFEDRALEIDIIGFMPMYFESKYKKVLKNKEDLVKLFKEAFNDKVGSEVVGLDAIDKVAEKAANSDFSGKVAPVVLYSNDKELVDDLLKNLGKVSPSVFLVLTMHADMNEENTRKATCIAKNATKKQVEESLLKIRSLLN